MVQEVRQILLNADEVVGAIDAYRQMTPDFLPPGKITRCETTAAGTVKVFVEIIRDGFVRTADFTLTHTDILRPLIGFCLKNSVPLPKDGQKVALISEGSVALYVTRNVGVEIPAWATPMRLDQVKSVAGLSPADISLDRAAVRNSN